MAVLFPKNVVPNHEVSSAEIDKSYLPRHSNTGRANSGRADSVRASRIKKPKIKIRRELYNSVLLQFRGSRDDAVFFLSSGDGKSSFFLRVGVSHGTRDGMIRLSRSENTLSTRELQILAKLNGRNSLEVSPLTEVSDRIHIGVDSNPRNSIVNGRYLVDNKSGVISYARLRALASSI